MPTVATIAPSQTSQTRPMPRASRRPTARAYSGGGNLVRAELLLPPLGLAPADLGLGARDVRRELALLLGQALLELRERLLALLELLAADLHVGFQRGLAQLQLGFAVVELRQPVAHRLLHRAEALLAAVAALLLRLGDGLVARELRLARGEGLLALVEARRPVLEVAAAVLVALRVRERGLEAIQLRLARRQVELAPVELGGAGDGL